MRGRSLRASINQMEVGTLQEVDGLWSFEYATGWLGNPRGFALSPHLPLTAETLLDGASKRPVQWYFDNLLKGNRSGQYSIRINDQWRICFEWRDGEVWNVEIVDYH